MKLKKLKKAKPEKAARPRTVYRTKRGRLLVGKIENALTSREFEKLKGSIDLILTSPPFPLIKKKKYGNETGVAYLQWLKKLAPKLSQLLGPKGSIVIEIGNAWMPEDPVMSTLALEALLAFKQAGKLHLCQHIICHNPARLPSPAEWVTIKRIRLKDTYTHVWWLSRSKYPKADNRKVLLPYSPAMKQLLKRQKYNAGNRPSGHRISEKGFLKNNGGSIAPSVLLGSENASALPADLLRFSGTGWEKRYRDFCHKHNLHAHPARMQSELAAFFIAFLTDPKDTVFDPFGGSNTTGAVAESLNRRWITLEAREDYARGSLGRFKTSQILAKSFPQRSREKGARGKNDTKRDRGPSRRK